MEQKRKPIYRSYVLVIKNNKGIMEIDWTKVHNFSQYKKEKYKLERIDFFTRHFLESNDLLNTLLSEKIITSEDSYNARLWIYPAKQNSVTELVDGKKKKVSKPLYAPEHLQYGLAYKSFSPLFDDQYVIHLLQSKLNDFDFISKLFNKYAVQGSYSERACENLRAKIESTKFSLGSAVGAQYEYYERILKSFYKQYHDISEMYGLLLSIRAYSQNHNCGEFQSNEAIESARNNIREFYLREKYTVIKCTDGINDNRDLEFELDKTGYPKVSYLALHNLLMFIGTNLPDIFGPKEKETPKVKKMSKKNMPVEGQLSLFDLLKE